MDRLWKDVRVLYKEWSRLREQHQNAQRQLDKIQWECVQSRLLKRLRDKLYLEMMELRDELSEKPLCQLHFDVAIRAATALPADISGLIASYVHKHRTYKNIPMWLPQRGFLTPPLRCPCWCDWTLPDRPVDAVEVKFHTDMTVHWRCLGQEDMFLKPQNIAKMHKDVVGLYRFIESARPYLCDKSKIEDAKVLEHEIRIFTSLPSTPIRQKLAYGLNTAGFQPLLDVLAQTSGSNHTEQFN